MVIVLGLDKGLTLAVARLAIGPPISELPGYVALDFAGHFNRLVSLRFPLAITLVTIALAIAAGFGVVRLKVDDLPAETNFRIPR